MMTETEFFVDKVNVNISGKQFTKLDNLHII